MKENPVEILLVEDNPHDAEMTIRALRKQHLANHLEHVSDGEEALDFVFARGKFAHRKPDQGPRVILLDLKLPKIGGLDVLRTLKSDPETKHLPVVVLTSSREDKDIVESYQLGVNSYIVKPVDFDKFVQAVGELGWYWLLLNQPPE
ncbi:MAG: response regulator [Bacteroidales bacterium]